MIMQLRVAKYYYSWKVGDFLFLSHKTKVQTVKNVNRVAYVKNKPVEWRPTCHTIDTPLNTCSYKVRVDVIQEIEI